jgi:L-iditol 2-dehydrogenase
MIVQWLRILGAAQIVCTDVSDSNLEIAKKLGATVTLNPRKVDVIREIQQLTGDGVDLTLEATGNPAALLQTVPITRPRGKVVLGGNQPLDQSLKLGFIEDMMRRELSLIGCFMSYSAPFPGHEWHDTVQALLSGDLDMETMITHRIGLSAVPDIFAKIGAHQMTHLKIMLNPEA